MTYDGDQLSSTVAVVGRMQNRIPKLVLGLLLASGAMAAQAQASVEAPTEPGKPAATPSKAPINLSLPAASIATLPAPPPASAGFAQPVAATPTSTVAALPLTPQVAPVDLALQSSSEEVKRVARWVTRSRDNAGMPFVLIDKANARVYSFTPAGVLQASAPVLLGMAKGDRMIAPNSASMSQMAPQTRITPAGRFVSRLAIDSHGKELLVLDYDASISLHAVVKGTPKERRAERLASATSDDNRISFGCINAPPDFYANYISAPFKNTRGIVYVLPETSPAATLFGFSPDETAALGAQHTASAMNEATPPAASAPTAN